MAKQYEVLVRFPEEIKTGEPFYTTVHDHGNTYTKAEALKILAKARSMSAYNGCDFQIVPEGGSTKNA